MPGALVSLLPPYRMQDVAGDCFPLKGLDFRKNVASKTAGDDLNPPVRYDAFRIRVGFRRRQFAPYNICQGRETDFLEVGKYKGRRHRYSLRWGRTSLAEITLQVMYQVLLTFLISPGIMAQSSSSWRCDGKHTFSMFGPSFLVNLPTAGTPG